MCHGPLFVPAVSDQKPLSVEVGEASALRLLGAEQENAELRRRLEELQAQQEVRVQKFNINNPSLLLCRANISSATLSYVQDAGMWKC